ncbi:hypothetical protein FQA39_LY08769 [Lamprigera yunnana]|nr:hypothetical protein FQA39_LY08769 [Lamprigera yunnana]
MKTLQRDNSNYDLNWNRNNLKCTIVVYPIMLKEIKGVIYILFTFCWFKSVKTGPNNLHMQDGITAAEIIGNDIFFEIIDPVELEYTYRVRPAKDFGAPFNALFHVKNVPLVPAEPEYCCEIPNNVEDIKDNVVLIERGKCSFKLKTIIAERAGARAVIITDVRKSVEDYYIEMVDDDTLEEAHIPAGFLMGKNGFIIRKTLKKLQRNFAIINLPVNLTFIPIHEINQPPWLGW